MKTNWQTKKLSDICFFQEGPGIRKYEYKKNGYPIINVRCVQDGYIDLSNAQAVDPKFIKEKWSHFQVEDGDILFTTSGTIGRTAMATKDDLPLLMNTSVVRFKSLDEKELDRYFLAWLLRSPKFIEEVKSYSSGTAQKNVGPTHLKLISISYPVLSEQKRIVKILDEAFGKIEKAKENAEKNLQNSKELFKSYLKNVFANSGKDWEEKIIKEVCDLKSGTTIAVSLERTTGDIIYAKIADMTLPENLVEMNTSSRFVNKSEIKSSQIIPEGSIIFPKRGGAIATNKKRKIVRPTIVDLNTMAIIPSNKIDKDFLFHWFSLINLNDISNGTTIPQINNYSFDEVYISFPKSISEQKMIVKKIDSLSEQTKKLEEVYKKKLADLEELKKSILNKAFTGEL